VNILELLGLMSRHPSLIVTTIMILGVVFINGWTDAPNAIATCVSTKVIRPKNAIIMAAIFNFLGVLVMFFTSSAVAETIANMVDFGENYVVALNALCAGMVGVIAWGVLAWAFGIPSSESHALIAGITGAGLAAMTLGYKGVQIKIGWTSSWAFVFYGLILGCIFGFVVGWCIDKLIILICHKMDRNRTRPFFKYAEITSGAAMAFVHGAQDGMKFVGVFFLAVKLASLAEDPSSMVTITNDPSLWYLALIVSLVMGLGTSIGGYKIIKKVGMGMAKLEPFEGFATDATSAVGILLATFYGIPVSTTQVKSFSILGVGATKGLNKVNWNIAGEMILTWLFTFPGAGLIGYLLTLAFLSIPGLN
jgi:PiT family inorganic phosphate transporter